MNHFDARSTRQLLPYPALVESIEWVVDHHRRGMVQCLERTGLELSTGTTVFSMLSGDEALVVNKTVTVNPGNPANGRPTVGGQVAVLDARNGAPLMTLDGPSLTARRTAAVSSLAIRALRSKAASALVVGTGVLATAHIECMARVNGIGSFLVHGRNGAAAAALVQFARGLGLRCEISEDLMASVSRSDVIVTATSSMTPVLPCSGYAGRLIVAVGAYKPTMAELPARLVLSADAIIVDRREAAQLEAGDLTQARVDFGDVIDLADVLAGVQVPWGAGHQIFKSVGHALWDLAAARVAHGTLSTIAKEGATCPV